MSSISSIGSGIINSISSLGSNKSTQPGNASNALSSIFGGQKKHGHHGGAMQKLQDAVTNALQSAKTSSSSTDPNKTIQDAISKILKGFGSSASSGTPNFGDDSDVAAVSDTGTQGMSFSDVLKSFGVTSDEFQNDFQSAIKNVMSDVSNPSKSFQDSMSSGSLLDAIG